MKILITNDGPTANKFIRLGYARAFQAAGHNVYIHEIGSKPLFDIFDEFEPDLLMTQTYNITETMVKCIEERPAMKVIMKGSDWGSLDIDLKEFPVLVANNKEIELISLLKSTTGKPDFIHGHYHPNRIQKTHGCWNQINDIPIVGLMSAADIFSFTNGEKREAFDSDICFVGGYWGYKARSLDKYIIPLCNPNKPYRVKIFGNQPWGISQYCGFLKDELVKDALASATICPNISEPHSQVYGYDIVERPWKLLSNKCFCISDYVESMDKDVFTNDEIVFAKNPQEFEELIVHYLKYPDERLGYIERGYNTVMSNHTYFHRIISIFENLGLSWEANNILKVYEEIRSTL